eukprot:2681813-Pyramimonas_sp.AAC.1
MQRLPGPLCFLASKSWMWRISEGPLKIASMIWNKRLITCRPPIESIPKCRGWNPSGWHVRSLNFLAMALRTSGSAAWGIGMGRLWASQ